MNTLSYRIFTYEPFDIESLEREFSLHKLKIKRNNYNQDDIGIYDKLGIYYIDKDKLKKAIENLIYGLSNHNFKGNKEQMINKMIEYIDKYTFLMLENYHKDDEIYVELFFKALIAFGKELDLLRIVNTYYSCFLDKIDNEFPDVSSMILNFKELYVKAACKALLINSDFKLGLDLYKLILLDWHDKPYQSKQKKESEEIEKVVSFFENDKDLLVENCFQNDKNLQEMINNYQEIIKKVNFYSDYRSISNDVDTFINTNKKYAEKSSLKLYRVFFYFLLSDLKEKCILPSLCSLADEKEEVQSKYINIVINCIKKIDNNTLHILSIYANNCSRDNEKKFKFILFFSKAMYSVNIIRHYLLVEEKNIEMAYYTSLDNFLFMLPGKCKNQNDIAKLAIMNVSYMNDPNEGKMLLNYLGLNISNKDKERRNIHIPYIFLKSFTSQIDYLPMWEMYSGHSQGCCIVIDWEKIRKYNIGKDIHFYNVVYIENTNGKMSIKKEYNKHIKNYEKIENQLKNLKNISNGINTTKEKNILREIISNLQYLIKEASYSYEQEMRIIYSYPDLSDDFKHTQGEYPLLFVHPNFDLQIKEIILAPKFEDVSRKIPYIQEEVSKMCYHIGTKMPKISISNIDFR